MKWCQQIPKTRVILAVLLTTLASLLIPVYLRNKKTPLKISSAQAYPQNQIQYLGLYFANETATDTQQAKNFANVITVGNATEIQRAANNNLKSIFILTGALWQNFSSHKSAIKKPDYQQQWLRLWNEISPYKDNIIAFYIIDEPDLWLQNYGELAEVSSYIKSFLQDEAPNIATMVVFSPFFPKNAKNNNNLIPSSLDWVAFDEYNCVYRECQDGVSISEKIDWIANIQKQRGKKIWVILNGFVSNQNPNYIPTEGEQVKLNEINNAIVSRCMSRQECIGMLAFLYKTQVDSISGKNMIGIEAMPLTQQYLSTLKNLVTSGAIRYEEQSFGINIATRKTAIASSQAGTLNSPYYAIDNNLSTSWNAGNFPPQWINIDLGSEQTITGVKLYALTSPNTNAVHNIYVSNLNNNSSFRKIATFDEYVVNGQLLSMFFPQKISQVRYLKVETTSSNSWVAWNEIKVFSLNPTTTPTPTPQENILSLNKPATASQSHPLTPPQNAVNGNLSDSWNAGNFPPQWIEIDLLREYLVSDVNLLVSQSPSGKSTTHRIWIAGNNRVFSKIKTFDQKTYDNQWLNFRLPTPQTARFIKIETTKSPSWVGWKEIRVMGR